MSRRPLRALAVLLVLVVGAPSSSAAYAADELAVSRDGRTWVAGLEEPLFEPARRWVPGDVVTRSFHVRNAGSGAAVLRIEVTSVDHHAMLSSGDLGLAVEVGGAGWVELDPAPGVAWTAEASLGAGDRREVAVRAAFDASSPNRSQRSRADLGLRVVLVGVPPTEPGGQLPDTGAPGLAWAVALAALLLGSGLALVRRSQRRPEEAPDDRTR